MRRMSGVTVRRRLLRHRRHWGETGSHLSWVVSLVSKKVVVFFFFFLSSFWACGMPIEESWRDGKGGVEGNLRGTEEDRQPELAKKEEGKPMKTVAVDKEIDWHRRQEEEDSRWVAARRLGRKEKTSIRWRQGNRLQAEEVVKQQRDSTVEAGADPGLDDEGTFAEAIEGCKER